MPNPSPRDPKFADEPDEYYRPGVTEDDTEGHRAAFITDDGSTDGPEGMKTRVTDEGDDTEGHKLRPNVTDDGTIPNAPEGIRARVTDDGDDTEGHMHAL